MSVLEDIQQRLTAKREREAAELAAATAAEEAKAKQQQATVTRDRVRDALHLSASTYNQLAQNTAAQHAELVAQHKAQVREAVGEVMPTLNEALQEGVTTEEEVHGVRRETARGAHVPGVKEAFDAKRTAAAEHENLAALLERLETLTDEEVAQMDAAMQSGDAEVLKDLQISATVRMAEANAAQHPEAESAVETELTRESILAEKAALLDSAKEFRDYTMSTEFWDAGHIPNQKLFALQRKYSSAHNEEWLKKKGTRSMTDPEFAVMVEQVAPHVIEDVEKNPILKSEIFNAVRVSAQYQARLAMLESQVNAYDQDLRSFALASGDSKQIDDKLMQDLIAKGLLPKGPRKPVQFQPGEFYKAESIRSLTDLNRDHVRLFARTDPTYVGVGSRIEAKVLQHYRAEARAETPAAQESLLEFDARAAQKKATAAKHAFELALLEEAKISEKPLTGFFGNEKLEAIHAIQSDASQVQMDAESRLRNFRWQLASAEFEKNKPKNYTELKQKTADLLAERNKVLKAHTEILNQDRTAVQNMLAEIRRTHPKLFQDPNKAIENTAKDYRYVATLNNTWLYSAIEDEVKYPFEQEFFGAIKSNPEWKAKLAEIAGHYQAYKNEVRPIEGQMRQLAHLVRDKNDLKAIGVSTDQQDEWFTEAPGTSSTYDRLNVGSEQFIDPFKDLDDLWMIKSKEFRQEFDDFVAETI